MLKRLGFKASIPALFPGGRRSISEVASNFPFANGGEGLRSRCNTGLNDPVNSSRTYNMGPWGKLHGAVASSKQSTAFPRHEAEAVEKLKASLPNCSAEDEDDFAELGPQLLEGAQSGFDMAIEGHKHKESSGVVLHNLSPQLAKSSTHHVPVKMTNIKNSLKQDSCSPGTYFNSEDHNDISRVKGEAETQKYEVESNQNHPSSAFICIDKVPRGISLIELRGAVSIYGEILSASMKTGQGGLTSCQVKFKSMKSKERAVAAKWITVRSCRLPVRSLCTPEYFSNVTVRLSQVSMETAEPAIHSMCMSCGYVAGLARTKEGAVDVVFRVKDHSVTQSILKQLNDVFIDDCRWLARLLTKLDQNPVNVTGSQWGIGSQISNVIENCWKQLQMQRIYLEDLENLHHAVLHLKDRPADTFLLEPNKQSDPVHLM